MRHDYPLASRILREIMPDDPMIVVDGGASGGGEFTRWRSLFPDVRLYAFEPDAEELAYLAKQEQAYASHIIYSSACLGRDQKQRPLYLSHERFNASFLEFDFDHYHRKRGYKDGDLVRVDDLYSLDRIVTVDSTSLDTFFRDAGARHADYIKVDIEGVELELLEASPENLANAIAVSIDVIFHRDWHGAAVFAEVDEFMRSNGFSLFDLRSIKRNEQFDAPTEFFDEHGNRQGQAACGDAIYLRDHLAAGTTQPSFDKLLKTAVAAEVNHIAGFAFEMAKLAIDAAPSTELRNTLSTIVAKASADHIDKQHEFSGHRRMRGLDSAVRNLLPEPLVRGLRPLARSLRKALS